MIVRHLYPVRTLAAIPLIVALAACAGAGSDKAGAANSTAATPTTTASAAGPQTPDPGRKVIVVEATTDEQGNNVFRPAKVEAHRGDVIRFTLKAGVHNVHFLPDSNPGKGGLPAASDMLQIPGQTYDVKVTFEPGKYYFQCDPHALLGMKGQLEVEGD
ncbi:MAG TPA: plastocyanin/azurin family copper-binding protein [Gemmatimonadaceae bacterium]|nr:plastocyanin/azurin family copper-binding protein [Gemmatimonadaceae bacterium]